MLLIPVGSKFDPTPIKLLRQSALFTSLPAPAQAFAASLIDKRVSKLNKFPQDTAAVVSTPLSVTIVETTAPSPKKAVASSACIPIVIPLVADKISLVASVAISV